MLSFSIPDARPSFAAALPSTTVHVALLIAAIWGTRATTVAFGDHIIEIPLEWTPTSSHPAASTAASMVIPGAPVLHAVTIPRIDLPGIPPLDPGWHEVFPPNPTTPAWTGVPGFSRGDSVSSTQVFSESEVDDLPSLLSPGRLRYPAVLADAGIDGAVTLTFVIDTTGKVDPSGIEVLSTTHPGFVAAAREAVSTSLFRPARKHGVAVRVRVRQTITFKH